jgi:hypothetical protein
VQTRAPAPARTGTATDRGGEAATDEQVLAWAQHFGTTPDEVKSWFDAYSSQDTIGGEGSLQTLHQGDSLTISDASAIADGAAAAGFMDVRSGNEVDVKLHSTPVPLGSALTDAQGKFSITVKIPSPTSLGRHYVIALAPNTKQGLIAFVFPVNVVQPEPVFNVPAVSSTSSKHSGPWLKVEVFLGLLTLAALVAFRVRRGVTAR